MTLLVSSGLGDVAASSRRCRCAAPWVGSGTSSSESSRTVACVPRLDWRIGCNGPSGMPMLSARAAVLWLRSVGAVHAFRGLQAHFVFDTIDMDDNRAGRVVDHGSQHVLKWHFGNVGRSECGHGLGLVFVAVAM